MLLKKEDYFRGIYMVVKGVLCFFRMKSSLNCSSQSGGQLVSREGKC